MTIATSAPPGPVLRILRGNPTPEELAAATAVLCALPAPGTAQRESPAPPGWQRPAHHVPAGAWRTVPR
ncbi:acyl-CoA carboxylase subunit epsilon [Streptomyces sp. NPDC048275]|uniref:acyl-CoA carboxylase subunit epsilon n=1 Tax=Streptomyces sp. NPDC048275 TaxID=3155629 RepID=UPI0034114869